MPGSYVSNNWVNFNVLEHFLEVRAIHLVLLQVARYHCHPVPIEALHLLHATPVRVFKVLHRQDVLFDIALREPVFGILFQCSLGAWLPKAGVAAFMGGFLCLLARSAD